jgi:hypothetical protein
MIVHKSIYECITHPEIIDSTYRFSTKFPHSPYSIYILPTTTLLAMDFFFWLMRQAQLQVPGAQIQIPGTQHKIIVVHLGYLRLNLRHPKITLP